MEWVIPLLFATGTLISALFGIWKHSVEWGDTGLVLGFSAAISGLIVVATVPWRK